jgi:hypothetical protein
MIEFTRNNDKPFKLFVVDIGNTVVDITGATVYMTVSNSSGTQIFQKVVTDHIVPESGLTEIDVAKADTALLEDNEIYDVQVDVVFPDAQRFTIVQDKARALRNTVVI